jgi:ABC-type amino acid transport substrate-binding protein
MRLTGIAGVLLSATLALTGCGLPRDTESTLADVRGGTLTVGITDNPPWTSVPDQGAEAELVRRLATRLGSTVEWRQGPESQLMPALKDRELDLVIGGLTADLPWIEDAALTRPYLTDSDGKEHVWATSPGENAWLVEVEGFLLALSEDEVADLLAAAPK